jgi:hypothetical protein
MVGISGGSMVGSSGGSMVGSSGGSMVGSSGGSMVGSSGGSLVVTPDWGTTVLGLNPAIFPAYNGLPVLRRAAIWDGTSL